MCYRLLGNDRRTGFYAEDSTRGTGLYGVGDYVANVANGANNGAYEANGINGANKANAGTFLLRSKSLFSFHVIGRSMKTLSQRKIAKSQMV